MYRNILVPVDLDDPSESAGALASAAAIAKCFSSRVTICSVVRDADALARGEWLPISYEQLLFEAHSKLDSISSGLGKELAPDIEVGTGTICSGILEVAERISADLIVLASHRPGVADYVHAANAARVARRAPCSVLIVRAAPPDQDRRHRHSGEHNSQAEPAVAK